MCAVHKMLISLQPNMNLGTDQKWEFWRLSTKDTLVLMRTFQKYMSYFVNVSTSKDIQVWPTFSTSNQFLMLLALLQGRAVLCLSERIIHWKNVRMIVPSGLNTPVMSQNEGNTPIVHTKWDNYTTWKIFEPKR